MNCEMEKGKISIAEEFSSGSIILGNIPVIWRQWHAPRTPSSLLLFQSRIPKLCQEMRDTLKIRWALLLLFISDEIFASAWNRMGDTGAWRKDSCANT
ncbi:hypothetical protein TNIN_266651 [Trichonephila inaurata madagascariensis]|uniref:Uncharacterized protein n=1 Tax=Trichonephila inaurata madagascariensis TaxID=2747483 RepID=A0A8X7BT19_9ARAC|nr:hypothetical protein TNIN_266651 [Trichonephila inaurata madagascariensis]